MKIKLKKCNICSTIIDENFFQTHMIYVHSKKHESLNIKNNIAAYGLHLGIAFQLIDDLLDYQDLTEGNLTLPIIYLLKHGSKQEKTFVKKIINTKAKELLPELQTIIASSGAIAYTIKHAKQEACLAKAAISTFADSTYKDAACYLIDFIISRDY